MWMGRPHTVHMLHAARQNVFHILYSEARVQIQTEACSNKICITVVHASIFACSKEFDSALNAPEVCFVIAKQCTPELESLFCLDV
jgi:hypothetical protein